MLNKRHVVFFFSKEIQTLKTKLCALPLRIALPFVILQTLEVFCMSVICLRTWKQP